MLRSSESWESAIGASSRKPSPINGVLGSTRLKYCFQAVVLAGGTLLLLVRPDVRVGQRRGALYGLLIYLQGDRTRSLVGYGFGRNKIVLLSKAEEPARDDIHEPQVHIVIDVEVRHLTDVSTPGVEDSFLAEFLVRGAWMLVVLQPDQVHWDL